MVDVAPIILEEDKDQNAAIMERRGGACWLSTKVCDTLYELGDTMGENKRIVNQILEYPKEECPQDLLLTLHLCKLCPQDLLLDP